MSLHLRYVAHSEIGLVRKNNQDSGYASPTLLVIADGMGGAAAGDLASAVAITELAKADGSYEGEDMLERLAGAVHKANDRIADLVDADHDLDGMGTTVCGAMFDGTQLGIVHLGDSRGYLLRDGELMRLTHDHSWVQSLVDEGRITEAEAAFHPHRSLLLKVLNGLPTNEPDLSLVEVVDGDRIMFCSDGLCGLVEDEDLADILAHHRDLDDCLDSLVEAAHYGGGIDNITIALADVTAADVPAAAPLMLGAAVEREIPAITAKTGREDTARLTRKGTVIGDGLDEDGRYAPTGARRRFPVLKAVVITLAVLALIGGIIGGVYGYSRSQFYVGAANNSVAIYQGIPDKLLGVQMHQVYEVTETQLTDLPPYYQEQVKNTIAVADLDAAHATVTQLSKRAEACVAQRQARAQSTTTPTPTPTKTPSKKPSATTSGSVSPSPSATASATPTEPPAPEEC